MGVTKGAIVVAICAATALSGCSVQAVQKTPPESAADCRTYWLQERGAISVRAADETNSFDAFILALFSGVARTTTSTEQANRRYRTCLAQFGVEDSDAFENAAGSGDPDAPYLRRLPPKRPAHCPRRSSVLYGGSGYCVGRY